MTLYYLCVIGIFKNETLTMKTWLDHYLWQGVEHFYLIDNGSTDNPENILGAYSDKITLYHLPEKYKQVDHYRTIYQKEEISGKTKWLIMADLDEFWYCRILLSEKSCKTLQSMMLSMGSGEHLELILDNILAMFVWQISRDIPS